MPSQLLEESGHQLSMMHLNFSITSNDEIGIEECSSTVSYTFRNTDTDGDTFALGSGTKSSDLGAIDEDRGFSHLLKQVMIGGGGKDGAPYWKSWDEGLRKDD